VNYRLVTRKPFIDTDINKNMIRLLSQYKTQAHREIDGLYALLAAARHCHLRNLGCAWTVRIFNNSCSIRDVFK
jgi:hypothetical protein